MTTPDARVAAIDRFPVGHILGVPVHVIGSDQVVQLMQQWVAQRDRSRWIAVTSSHGIVEGYKYPEFKSILQTASLSVPDGKWTAKFAAWHCRCASAQVRGADLLLKSCEISSERGYRNFFYGDTEEVLAVLTAELRRQFPNLKIAGTYSPPFRELSPEEDAQITDVIRRADPDILWVGLGLPKQERWIYEHRDKLQVPVVVAVGAAFKFASGKVKAAPAWVSNCGMEWAWRFAHEPRRLWHRVLIYGPQFVIHSLLELAALQLNRQPREVKHVGD